MGMASSVEDKINDLQYLTERHPERIKEYQQQVLKLLSHESKRDEKDERDERDEREEIDFFNEITTMCSKHDIDNIISLFSKYKKEFRKILSPDMCSRTEQDVISLIKKENYDEYTMYLYTTFLSSFFRCVTDKKDCEYLVSKYVDEE